MTDTRIEKLADLLVTYSVEVKIGQEVAIRCSSLSEPLLQAIYIITVGADLQETASLNQSAIHWDMICVLHKGGQIWADDQLLSENGYFTLDL